MKTSVATLVLAKDLPATCPPEHNSWNLHPLVYLLLKPGDEAVACPYCGTRYQLASDEDGADN